MHWYNYSILQALGLLFVLWKGDNPCFLGFLESILSLPLLLLF